MIFTSSSQLVACLKRAVYLSPFEWIINFNLGILHLSTGQHASAFYYFSTSINLNPSYARSYMYLAVALSRLDDFENSCSAYEKALELGGEDFLTYLNYAITLFLNDELELAQHHFNSYLTLFNKAGGATPEIDPNIIEKARVLEQLLNN